MSLVENLSLTTAASIASTLGLREIGSKAQPYRLLRSQAMPTPVGAARAWQGLDGMQLIYIGLAVPAIRLDSHMLFAFTAKDSQVPHFTLDAVQAGDHYAFHLDLIPRLELAVHRPYLERCYQPLTEAFSLGRSLPGLSPAELSPMQLALMSPWMLAHRANLAAMDGIAPISQRYLAHWLGLVQSGVDCEVHGLGPAARDVWHRSMLFDKAIDPVWHQVERLLGVEAASELNLLLQRGIV